METIQRGSAWEALAQIRAMAAASVKLPIQIALIWIERARSRRLLAQIDDRMMRDIGVSRAEIMVETSKPFWRE
jgi:uncharacterized protein YjiS (DUF1127 family)